MAAALLGNFSSYPLTLLAAVVTGIVPSTMVLALAALTGCLVKLGRQMARRMRIATPQIYAAAAALAVVSASRQPESISINFVSDFERCAPARGGLKNVPTRLAHLRNVGNLNTLAGSRVVAGRAGCSLQNRGATVNSAHCECCGRRA